MNTDEMSTQERFRRLTPLGVMVLSLAITLFGLPSVLNLPQANPSQVPEYAPVPPDSDTTTPPGARRSRTRAWNSAVSRWNGT